ncbi:sugar transferase [Blastococcus sp. KM273129]|uniref:sugar transferase n=1 Tax=Blastococcus sp. KM273129 TaxID=2570315 RepID=UPI001F2312DD|nr:sugar transferase [Blastococcus sp. KM273129]MCF6735149.1 sugar transferase [Blastococcus sp. KM273129]
MRNSQHFEPDLAIDLSSLHDETPPAASHLHAVAGSAGAQPWQVRYVRRIMVSDAACAVVAAAACYLVRFGQPTDVAAASLWLAVLLPAVWIFSMSVARTYEPRFLWTGTQEFQRIFLAAAILLATVGTVSWAMQLELARGFVILALPLVALATLVQRYAWRRSLRRRWHRGEHIQRTLLVGHFSGVEALHEQIQRQPPHGHHVLGCCLPSRGQASHRGIDLPVLGQLEGVVGVVRRYDVDTVIVVPSPELEGAALRRLAWDLEKTPAELLLAPAITEIVGSRVGIRPLFGLPLMHVDRPELTGVRRLTKDLFDRTAALGLLVLIAPVLLGITVALKVSSPGPVLFRQERVGRHGAMFSMLKFRTMVVGADRMVEVLSDEHDGNGVLFKKRDDPRVTRIGAVLRRYSLDELPQLINVLRGEMSLVGPRPPLRSEVDRYGFDMHRRFLVKPGLTGLWQVSGRSNLSWNDSVRADLLYVENWSLKFDLVILWRTFQAVRRGEGAY